MKKAFLIQSDGEVFKIEPEDKIFTLPELYEVLDTNAIEIVNLNQKEFIVVDSNAKMADKPRNENATEILHFQRSDFNDDYIAGNCIICSKGLIE
jgi:hypothetical protein